MTQEERRKRGALTAAAIRRLNRAVREGFYLEAITLCDSIIRDRVHAILNSSHGEHKPGRGTNDLLRLIENLQNTEDLPLFDDSLLQCSLDWYRSRNSAIHGFSRLVEFQGLSWRGRLKKARESAIDGQDLVKRWHTESRKHRM